MLVVYLGQCRKILIWFRYMHGHPGGLNLFIFAIYVTHIVVGIRHLNFGTTKKLCQD